MTAALAGAPPLSAPWNLSLSIVFHCLGSAMWRDSTSQFLTNLFTMDSKEPSG
eukprot:CAMPEP_0204050204 /NCGR_PEP_ID=MMETSP0360-20130528/119859_1 /ASSEMBLY_ACC=CAM_ASM_000342 /TAXON_ID=268821 /ORGANISM="Scrippsiella Hangoei, Strain SHTV-5" /LENGTH=52 /DNA_ID=CAMNT_0050997153 /DNA_START=443 /DNA_END=601 /DNA_ORIENTATION=-